MSLPVMRPRLLIISNDVVGSLMAGPGIRCWELAKALGAQCRVTLAVPNDSDASHPDVQIVRAHAGTPELHPHIDAADTVMLDAWSLQSIGANIGDKRVIADMYDPFILENLELFREHPNEARCAWIESDRRITESLLRRADLVICASERQRDYWLGALTIAGRVTPRTYDGDEGLARLLAVVPFGISAEAPKQSAPFVRGVRDGIGPQSRILVWGGGLWNWLDPLTLVRAMPQIIQQHPDTRLVFPGTRHPNTAVPDMHMRRETVALAASLGLLDSHIIFGDWVPYAERANYLLEADLGVSLHPDRIETRLAFRTRLLDYIWAGLPMVVTTGDIMSDWVREWGLGEVVPFGDANAVAEAVGRLLSCGDLRARYAPAFARAAGALRWDRVSAPIREFCARGMPAADRRAELAMQTAAPAPSEPTPATATLSDSDGLTVLRSERDSLQQQAVALSGEVSRLNALVGGYERGRFIRLMRWIARQRGRV